MPRLPINMATQKAPDRKRFVARDVVFFLVSFAAVFIAALLVLEMMLG